MTEKPPMVSRQARKLAGHLQDLLARREQALGTYTRHLQSLKKPYTLYHAAAALDELEKQGWLGEENERYGLSALTVGLNHMLFEQVIRESGLEKEEKAAARRAGRAYANLTLSPGTPEKTRARGEQYRSAMAQLAGMKAANEIHKRATARLEEILNAMNKKVKSTHAFSIMNYAAHHFMGFLDHLKIYIDEPDLRHS